MIRWVVEAARASKVADLVLVATPDQEIVDACRSFGADAVLTRPDHPSGTDRIAEVAETIDAEVLVNVQGDEPLIRPESIRACAEPLLARPEIQMGTLWAPCPEDEIDNPAVVKVVSDAQGYALYFSRYPIPYPRNERAAPVKKHPGVYAYRREVVQAFSRWPVSPLEQTEILEQLRFLENGVRILLSRGEGATYGVDTPEQADEVRRLLSERGM